MSQPGSVKILEQDFLTCHIGELLVRQPSVAKPQARVRSCSRGSLDNQPDLSQAPCGGFAIDLSRRGSGSTSSSATVRPDTSFGQSNNHSSFRTSFGNSVRSGSQGRSRSTSEHQPDISSQFDHFSFGRRRTGTEVPQRISFTTSFGSRPRKPARQPFLQPSSFFDSERFPSRRSTCSSSASSESISSLETQYCPPWGGPPLETDLDGHHKQIPHTDWINTLPIEPAHSLDTEDTYSPTCTDGVVSTRSSSPTLQRSMTPTMTASSETLGSFQFDYLSTPISQRCPSTCASSVCYPISVSSRPLSCKHVKKPSLVPTSGDGRTFRFVEPSSESDSDMDASSLSPAPVGSELDALGLSFEPLGEENASAIPIRETKTVDLCNDSFENPELPGSSSLIQLSPEQTEPIFSLNKNITELNSKPQMMEILGQKIKRRGRGICKPNPNLSSQTDREIQKEVITDYHHEERTFKLKPVAEHHPLFVLGPASSSFLSITERLPQSKVSF